ncbi:MAG: hypothetical protein UZ03_NOB001000178, partial [Nitrospira sp. OLB3]
MFVVTVDALITENRPIGHEQLSGLAG